MEVNYMAIGPIDVNSKGKMCSLLLKSEMGLGFRVRAEMKYQAHALGKTKSIRLISNVGMLVH